MRWPWSQDEEMAEHFDLLQHESDETHKQTERARKELELLLGKHRDMEQRLAIVEAQVAVIRARKNMAANGV